MCYSDEQIRRILVDGGKHDVSDLMDHVEDCCDCETNFLIVSAEIVVERYSLNDAAEGRRNRGLINFAANSVEAVALADNMLSVREVSFI